MLPVTSFHITEHVAPLILDAEDEPVLVTEDNANDVQVVLRVLMDEHRLSYRAMDDIINLVKKHPDMKGTKNVKDVLQRSKLPQIHEIQICARCSYMIVDKECSKSDW